MATTAPAPTTPATPPIGAIPGPAGHPLLGMVSALRGDLVGTLLDNFARYGDVVSYRIGPVQGPRRLQRDTVAVHHPTDVRRVFTDTDAFTRLTTSYLVLHELFGHNLVTSNGEHWRRQKRMLQPLFTRRRVAEYAALIEAEAQAVVERQASALGAPMDTAHAMEEYALRVLGHTLFKEARGIDGDTVAALERLVPVVGTQVSTRARQFVRLPLRWPTARNRAFRDTRGALYATVERVLAKRAQGERAAAQDDLLGRLREARDPDGGAPLSDQEVRDQALIFLLAGHTTTSNALTTTLYLLGRHPELQEQVAAAADATAPGVGEDDLVRAAVQEAMRLYPPAYALARRVLAPTDLAGYELPAGTNVLVSPWVTHRHPVFWSDPEVFDPWRFMGPTDRPPYAYFPFGGGARACIGRHLALLEATILVRALLRRFRLESLDARFPMSQLISMRPSGPVRVACHPR